MELTVQCFGPARRLVGDTIVVTLVEPALVSDVVEALAARNDELADLLPHCAIAVGDEIVERSHAVATGDVVAVLPPVNGGCA